MLDLWICITQSYNVVRCFIIKIFGWYKDSQSSSMVWMRISFASLLDPAVVCMQHKNLSPYAVHLCSTDVNNQITSVCMNLEIHHPNGPVSSVHWTSNSTESISAVHTVHHHHGSIAETHEQWLVGFCVDQDITVVWSVLPVIYVT